jgi:putative transposase
MGIEALVPRPGTSKAAPGHKIYPYLLRGVSITEPNHVWASDITYSAPRPEESGERMFGMQCERRKCEEPASCCEEA